MKQRTIRTILLVSLLLSAFGFTQMAQAQSETGTSGVAFVNGSKAGKVHLREFSSTASPSLGLYYSGTKVLCESDPTDEWVAVSIGSQFGYMKSAFLSPDGYAVHSRQPIGTVKSKNTGSVNLRAEPSLQAAIVSTVRPGDTVIIQGETVTRWYYVQAGDLFGYIKTPFVQTGGTSATAKPLPTALPIAMPTFSPFHQPRIAGYTLQSYAPTPAIRVQYPVFHGHQVEALNSRVYAKAQAIGEYGQSGLTASCQCAVTFYNTKIVSMVFWGDVTRADAAYPTGVLTACNVDLAGLEELRLSDLFILEGSFEPIFFSRAFFPTDPITSYDAHVFPQMLKMQSKEYMTVSPFSIPNNVSFFLKPNGVVFSMPAVHATGSDHFEAQMSYQDVRNYYRLNNVYWID